MNSRLGSRLREVSAFPKPWSSPLTCPSLHFPPLFCTFRKGRALALNSSGCSPANLPEQERNEQLSSIAQSSKRCLSSAVLVSMGEAHQPKHQSLGDAFTCPVKSLKVSDQSSPCTLLVPVLSRTITMGTTHRRDRSFFFFLYSTSAV